MLFISDELPPNTAPHAALPTGGGEGIEETPPWPEPLIAFEAAGLFLLSAFPGASAVMASQERHRGGTPCVTDVPAEVWGARIASYLPVSQRCEAKGGKRQLAAAAVLAASVTLLLTAAAHHGLAPHLLQGRAVAGVQALVCRDPHPRRFPLDHPRGLLQQRRRASEL